MTRRALVGGGLAGIAWETGILTGLADAGLDVTNADCAASPKFKPLVTRAGQCGMLGTVVSRRHGPLRRRSRRYRAR